MNHPDITKIIDEIATQLECGMQVCLNIDTGEIEYYFGDSYSTHDYEDWEKEYNEKMAKWPNKMLFEPLNSHDSFEMMEDFINENVRKDTPLYNRLINAIKGSKPFARFKGELAQCCGHNHWNKFKDRCYQNIVANQIIEELGMPNVKYYNFNNRTLQLMAEAHIAGKYIYVIPRIRMIIISQVTDQYNVDFEGDAMIEHDTFYTIKEWALRMAEERKFQYLGGGLVYEPLGLYEEPTEEERDAEYVIKELKRGIHWIEEEADEFDDFCAEQYKDESIYEDASNEGSPILDDFLTGNTEKQDKYDGKYPIKGGRQDIFSDEDPWGPPF